MVARADSCLTLAAQCAYRNYAGFGTGTVYLFAILRLEFCATHLREFVECLDVAV